MKKITLLFMAGMLAFLPMFGQVEEVIRSTNSAANLSNNVNKVNWTYTNTWVANGSPSQQGFTFFGVAGIVNTTIDSVAFNFQYKTLDPNNDTVEVAFFYKDPYANPRWSSISYPNKCFDLGTMKLTTVGNYRFSSAALTEFVQAKITANAGFNIIMRTVDTGTKIGIAGKVGGVNQSTMTLYSNPAAQSIAFGTIKPVPFSMATPITLIDTASSGLTVTYVSSDETVATVSGNVVTPVGLGKATITASQAGDDTFDPATDVQQEVYYAPDSITYYVRADGSESNDGLSAGSAFSTLAQAMSAAVSDAGAVVYVVDVDGVITSATANWASDIDHDVTLVVKGDDAATDILQMKTDEDYATAMGGGRFISATTNSGKGELTVKFEDLTFRNAGFSGNWNGGILMNINSGSFKVNVSILRCNILRSVAHSGAVLHFMGAAGGLLTMEDCFVSEMTTFAGGYISPIRVTGACSANIQNCVFSNCVKADGAVHGKFFGSVVSFEPNSTDASLTLINNTFVGDSIVDPDMTVPQSAISIKSTVDSVPVTIANNLFVGNASLAAGQAYYDVYVDTTSSMIILNNSSNNVMNSQLGLDTLVNDVDTSYTYTSTEINVTMDGEVPMVLMTPSGVGYVKAEGSSVVGMALASVAPAMDIAGTVRANPGSVGAFEFVPFVKLTQTIDFEAIAPIRFSQSKAINLVDTASSGLMVSYVSSDTTVVTVNGHVLTPVGLGKAMITASQAGNDTYEPAPNVAQAIYFAPDSLTYYVRADGAESNDGLSEATAFSSLLQATNAAVADGGAIAYTVSVGAGAIAINNLVVAFDRTDDIALKIMGESAATTYYERMTDSAFVAGALVKGKYYGRFLNNPTNTGGKLSVELEDMTFRNFGYTNSAKGSLIELNSTTDVDLTMRRCNVLRAVARSGALVQAANLTSTSTITMEDCFFSEIYTFNQGTSMTSPIFIRGNNSFVAKNCVFSDFARINPTPVAKFYDDKSGSVIDFQPSSTAASLTLVNNTFVGDSTRLAMTVDQSTVYIKSAVESVPVTIANNIFMGGGAISAPAFYDVLVDSSTMAFSNSTNNVMTLQLGLGAAGNIVDPAFTYVSPAINFTMEEEVLEQFFTTTGVGYVIADGASIAGMGLASVATATDITGAVRSATAPSVGAYEAEVSAQLTHANKLVFEVYPNPTTGLVQFSGVEGIASVEVYNQLGQRVWSTVAADAQVDLSRVEKGMYFVKVTDAQGQQGVQTLVVR